MIYVALALVVSLAIVVTVGGGLLRSQQREHNRRESLLLNQLLHATGKPWLPAPADVKAVADLEPFAEPGRFVAAPEQYA